MISDQVREIPLVGALSSFDESAIIDASGSLGQLSIEVHPANIVQVCRFMKEEQKFVRLSGLTGVDWYPAEPRFEVIYLLHSLEKNQRVRLKARVASESPEIDSVTPVWRGADWYEREVFDLFGIVFRGHPDLRRLMMPEGWDGHPLRKDFPVHGHKYDYAGE